MSIHRPADQPTQEPVPGVIICTRAHYDWLTKTAVRRKEQAARVGRMRRELRRLNYIVRFTKLLFHKTVDHRNELAEENRALEKRVTELLGRNQQLMTEVAQARLRAPVTPRWLFALLWIVIGLNVAAIVANVWSR